MRQSSQRFDKIVFGIRNETRLADAFKDGYTPDDIKHGVIELLSLYFSNSDVLEKSAVNILMSDAIALANLSKNTLAFDLFEYAFAIHQRAYLQDKNTCVQASVEWQPAIYEGLSIFWSQYHLELDKQNLPDDEFLHECLRNIGTITEGAIKHLIKELLQQQRVANGDYVSEGGTKDIGFGVAINELYRTSPNPKLFAPQGVRLSQWRNIAQHLSAHVEGTEFICKYGKPQKEIRLSRIELYQITKHILDLFSGLKLANTFFTVDHMSELVDAGLTPESMRKRNEMEISHIVYVLLSQGFEVVDFQRDEKESKLVVRDMTSLDPDKRKIHTVQFVDLLWRYAKSQIVSVEYIEQDGTPNFRTSATADLFSKIEKEHLHPSVIANEAEMIDLKNNLIIPKGTN